MWLSYLLAFAYLITLIRIVIFAFSSGSFEEKLGKARNWLIGLMIFTLSWFVLTRIFGFSENMKIKNQSSTEVNNSAFGTNNKDENSDGVPIKVD